MPVVICFYWVQIGSDGAAATAAWRWYFSQSGWIMESFFLFVCFKYDGLVGWGLVLGISMQPPHMVRTVGSPNYRDLSW